MDKKEELKRRFRHIPEIIMNQGDVDIADLEIAEDYVEHIPMPDGFPPNRRGFKDFVLMLRTAFPDLHYDVDHLTTSDLIGENQKVVHRIVAHGTHLGPWGPVPPTGKAMSWSEIHIGLYVQGMLVEHWGNIDTLAIMQQMGLVPGWQDRPDPPVRPVARNGHNSNYQENVEATRRYIREAWNKGKLEIIDEIFHPECASPAFPNMPAGPESVKFAIQMYRAGFPDLRVFIADTIAEESMVVVRFVLTGTHLGDFMGIPATGRDIEVDGCPILDFADGQIVEYWYEADQLGLLGQLGVGGQ